MFKASEIWPKTTSRTEPASVSVNPSTGVPVREATAPSGAELVRRRGFDHVLVGRPNDDGTVDVECVSTVDDAVSFLSEQPKAGGQE